MKSAKEHALAVERRDLDELCATEPAGRIKIKAEAGVSHSRAGLAGFLESVIDYKALASFAERQDGRRNIRAARSFFNHEPQARILDPQRLELRVLLHGRLGKQREIIDVDDRRRAVDQYPTLRKSGGRGIGHDPEIDRSGFAKVFQITRARRVLQEQRLAESNSFRWSEIGHLFDKTLSVTGPGLARIYDVGQVIIVRVPHRGGADHVIGFFVGFDLEKIDESRYADQPEDRRKPQLGQTHSPSPNIAV